MKSKFKSNLFHIVYRFIVIFSLVGFILTTNIILFLHLLSVSTGIVYDNANVHIAAIFTFWNAIFLGVVLALFDFFRRKLTVERPLKRIQETTQKITDGDFSARIKQVNTLTAFNDYKIIINDLNKMAEELSGIETLRTDFISNVSHELKTPLAVLQNYGTLLSQPDLPEEKRMEYAKAIIQNTSRLSELVTNILKINKLENQSIRPNLSVFNLSELLCENLLNFENIWEEKNINIETDIKEDIYIHSDPELISIIWNNLISNALKFTDNGGTVTAKLTDEGKYIKMSVSDTGCGMTEDTIKRIFDKFYQGDTSHSTKGNGLGLSIVKRIIDILNAEITVESELGAGTVFTVKIVKTIF